MIFLDHAAKWLFSALFASLVTLLGGAILLNVSARFLIPLNDTAVRSADFNNLRKISRATYIYTNQHKGRLPDATDLPDYARLLALDGGLDDVTCWVAKTERTSIPSGLETILIVAPDGSRALDPRFAKLPHLFTVVVGGLGHITQHPNPHITPIAWTRGLDLDTGEWRQDSPYRGEGGHILFLDGSGRFYHKLTNAAGGELTSRDGHPTHRILETLPAGIRISETTPSPANTRAERAAEFARRLSDYTRTAILLAWPIWMLILFFKLTLGFARTWGVPLGRVRLEPRSRWIVLTPVALLLLSFIFRV